MKQTRKRNIDEVAPDLEGPVGRIMGRMQEAVEKEVVDEINRLQDMAAIERAESQKQISAEWLKIETQRAQLNEERQAWESEKAMLQKVGIGSNDLITLNLGGEKLQTVKRSLLTQTEGSFLTALFSGRHEDSLDKDKDGHIFFDYSPHVLGPLIEYLRVLRDAGPGQAPELPSIPKEWETQWKSMVKFFGLEEVFTPAAYFFKGIRQHVRISQLHGWNMFFCKPWDHQTALADFVIPDRFQGNAIIVGSRKKDSDLLEIAAMGLIDVITKETDSTDSASSHNGAFWYQVPGRAIGFAPISTIELNTADAYDAHDARLSWGFRHGGWRSMETQAISCAKLQKVLLCATIDARLFT